LPTIGPLPQTSQRFAILPISFDFKLSDLKNTKENLKMQDFFLQIY